MVDDAPRVAFDATIFFHAVGHNAAEKHRRCAGLLAAAMGAGVGCAPLQALGEFCYAAVRKKVLTRRQAAAAQSGMTAIVSEDMSDGMVLGGVEIINPFTADLKKRLAAHSFSL